MTKEFDLRRRVDLVTGVTRGPSRRVGEVRQAFEAGGVARVLAKAVPPDGMGAAPVAPARGPMAQVKDYEIVKGGRQRLVGSHWIEVCPLTVMCHRVAARGGDRPLPFTEAQIATGRVYRGLVEWREGSAMKCASVEAGRGGSGSGVFIDRFIDRGVQLGVMRDAVGPGWVLQPRRHMDRGNARRSLSVLELVDLVLVQGMDLSGVLRRYGWQADGKNRRILVGELGRALDRMQRVVGLVDTR